MKKLLLVFNPRAGREDFRANLYEAIELFTKNGYEVTARPTFAPLEAQDIVASRAGDFDLVVCSGGDGTLNEAVSGLMRIENRPPLGYIPSGSTNDFASSLGLPRDILQAAAMIVNGEPRRIDAGSFNDRWFTYVAAFGLFTDVTYETPQGLKNVFGHTAYLLEGVRRLGSIQAYSCRVQTEKESFHGSFMFGMVTNSTQVAGFKMREERAVCLDDGLFEMVLVKRPRSLADRRDIAASLSSNQLLSESLIVRKVRSVRFSAEEPISWTLDGEFGGAPKAAAIECRHRALEILSPPVPE